MLHRLTLVLPLFALTAPAAFGSASRQCASLVKSKAIRAEDQKAFKPWCEGIAEACLETEREAAEGCGERSKPAQRAVTIAQDARAMIGSQSAMRLNNDIALGSVNSTIAIYEQEERSCQARLKECDNEPTPFTGHDSLVTLGCSDFKAESKLWSRLALEKQKICAVIAKELASISTMKSVEESSRANIKAQSAELTADGYDPSKKKAEGETKTLHLGKGTEAVPSSYDAPAAAPETEKLGRFETRDFVGSQSDACLKPPGCVLVAPGQRVPKAVYDYKYRN